MLPLAIFSASVGVEDQRRGHRPLAGRQVAAGHIGCDHILRGIALVGLDVGLNLGSARVASFLVERVEPVDCLDAALVGYLNVDRGGLQVGVPQQRLRRP